MKHIRLTVVFSCLLLAMPLHAQWSGKLDLSGGFGYMPPRTEDDFNLLRYLGQTGFELKYKSPAFQWNTSVGGSYEKREDDSYRISTSIESGTEVIQVDEIQKLNMKVPIGASLQSGIIWSPAKGRDYEAWIRFKFNSDNAANSTFKSHFQDIMSAEDTVQEKLYMEISAQLDNNIQTGFRTTYQLGSPRLVLQGQLSLERNHHVKQGSWIMSDISDNDLVNFHNYRITPESFSHIVGASVHLADSLITSGPCRLQLDPGIRFSADYSDDRNSGATYDSETDTWRDSTRLRENFDFLALRIEPYLSARFKWKDINAQMDYAPQLYARRLTDEIHQQALKLKRPYLVGNSLISWQITTGHKLAFRNNISVRHPSYIQICWYERQGNYLTQIYRGKENLLSTQTYAFFLDYEFRHKRLFSTTTLSLTARRNEIDQTFTNETIDGRDYQVFTWVNAADSRILGFSQQLGWRGKKLQADLGVSNNGTVRKAREGGAIKKTADWRIWADATLTFNKGWSIRADANYRSDVRTFFTLFKQYCNLNVRIQKNFKRMDIFLQGRDLLDFHTVTEYSSEDGLSAWAETARQNRRIVILGLQWRFGQ